MPDKTEPNEWDVAVAALAASGGLAKWKRGPSTEAQRAAMKAVMSKINTGLYVARELLDDEQYGTIDEDGIYSDPHRDLVMMRQARLMLEHAIEAMEATDWCLVPETKPDIP